jgi:hypothetical protein
MQPAKPEVRHCALPQQEAPPAVHAVFTGMHEAQVHAPGVAQLPV